MEKLKRLIREVHRRSLWQVLFIYVGAAWACYEIIDTITDRLLLPEWLPVFAIVLFLIGLPIVLATAFIQEGEPRPGDPGSSPVGGETDAADTPTVARPATPPGATAGLRRLFTWRNAIAGGVLALALWGLVAAGWLILADGEEPTVAVADGASPGVAILPFRVVGPDLELWREGMVDLLSTNLDGAAGLRTIDPRGLLSRWHSEIGEGEDAPNRDAALAVARGAGARYAVMGDAVALGGGVRLSAEVYDLSSDELLGRVRVEGATDSVLPLVDELSIQLLGSGLVREGAELPTLSLAGVTTRSLEALRAYLEGEQSMRRGDWARAAEQFGRAVEIDSTFALADYGLSLALGWSEPFSERSFEHSRRAARHSQGLPERIVLRMRGNAELDALRTDAIRTLERLTRRYPDDVEGWYRLGEAYTHLGARSLISPKKGVDALERVVELDPGYAAAYIHLIDFALYDADSARARRYIEDYREVGSGDPGSIAYSVAYDLLWADSAGKERARAALDTLDGEALGDVLAQSLEHQPDWHQEAEEIATHLVASRRPDHERAAGYRALAFIDWHRGRIEEARHAFAEAGVLGGRRSDLEAARFDLIAYQFDLEDPETARRAAEVLGRDPGPIDRFRLGVLAADEGTSERLDDQIAALDVATGDSLREGERVAAMASRSLAQALRCYAAIRDRDVDAALAEFERPMPRLPNEAHHLLRYELGKLILELDEPARAAPYFVTLIYSPAQTQAQYYLGEAYERMADEERARLHYGRFVRWWEDAEPPLRPWWERGRRALARLTGERRSD